MRKVDVIAALLAVFLFAWVLHHMGVATIVEQLKSLRLAAPIVLALSMLRLFLQTVAWYGT